MKAFAYYTMILSSVVLLSACGGGDSDNSLQATTVSRGQELIDLQKAYESGAISEKEYKDQKEQILDKD